MEETLKTLIEQEMKYHQDSFDNLEKICLKKHPDDPRPEATVMLSKTDDLSWLDWSMRRAQYISFLIWTKTRVYFLAHHTEHWMYSCESVPRNPCLETY
jgi:hypothetical protein